MKNAHARPSPGAALTPTRIVRQGAIRLRVRYCECDPMGVAHHSSYIAWLEVARTELLRECGVSYADLERAGTFLVITRLEVKYRRAIRYDDVIEVRTTWNGGSKVKIEHTYEVHIAERAGVPATETAAIAHTTLACVDAEGKIMMLPDWLAF